MPIGIPVGKVGKIRWHHKLCQSEFRSAKPMASAIVTQFPIINVDDFLADTYSQ